jgi:hypothetical protein
MTFIPVKGKPIQIKSRDELFGILKEPYLYFQDDGVKCPLGVKLGEIK